jgi:hypothetical protein
MCLKSQSTPKRVINNDSKGIKSGQVVGDGITMPGDARDNRRNRLVQQEDNQSGRAHKKREVSRRVVHLKS